MLLADLPSTQLVPSGNTSALFFMLSTQLIFYVNISPVKECWEDMPGVTTIAVESKNHSGWKNPLGSSSPTTDNLAIAFFKDHFCQWEKVFRSYVIGSKWYLQVLKPGGPRRTVDHLSFDICREAVPMGHRTWMCRLFRSQHQPNGSSAMF